MKCELPLTGEDSCGCSPAGPQKSSPGNSGFFYNGIRWNVASKYGMQVLRFATTIVLVRLLKPEAFGLLAMAEVVTGLAEVLARVGFGVTIVQRRSLDESLLHTIFWSNIGLCSILFLGITCAAPFVALAYDAPAVQAILTALSFNIIITSTGLVPTSLLTRELRFRTMALREVGAVAVYAVVSVGCALTGMGVWALVIGTLCGSVFQIAILFGAVSYRPRLVFNTRCLREILAFGINLTGVNLLGYLARQADKALVGFYLNSTSLGIYAIACKMAMLPREVVTRVLIRVLLPALSRLQDEPQKMRSLYLTSNAMIAFCAFPMMAGIAVYAEQIVTVLLGTAWDGCAPVIRVLAAAGAIQALADTRTQALLATANARMLLILTTIESSLYLLSFAIGIAWGLSGIAWAYLAATLVVFPIGMQFVAMALPGLSAADTLRKLLPSALSTGLMCSVLFAFRSWAGQHSFRDWPTLLFGVFLGAAVFLLAMALAGRQDLRRIFRLLNK